jgi:predicted lipoprotein with Yx(FWY)xxD motif
MARHRVIIAIITGTVALSAVGVGSAAAATHNAAATHLTSGHRASRTESAIKEATLHTATAKVNGRSETVLVNGRGLPLYYYELDTAKKSLVTGGLAQLWPPLLAARPTETGATGRLTVVKDASGPQVAYNGHFLYTFADDGPGQVNGQGVQDFFIATPSLKAIGSQQAPQAMTATTSGSYSY